MSKKLIQEMKSYSGVSLSESEISQAKTMSAESKLVGAFSSLLRELKFIQADSERPVRYYGGDTTPSEQEEKERTVDMGNLYNIAKSKLKIIESEIDKTFKREMKAVVKDDDDDDGDED